MRYKFEVTYMPAPMMMANNNMLELDPAFGELAMRETISISSKNPKPIDNVKRDVRYSFEKENCKVISIEGGIVE